MARARSTSSSTGPCAGPSWMGPCCRGRGCPRPAAWPGRRACRGTRRCWPTSSSWTRATSRLAPARAPSWPPACRRNRLRRRGPPAAAGAGVAARRPHSPSRPRHGACWRRHPGRACRGTCRAGTWPTTSATASRPTPTCRSRPGAGCWAGGRVGPARCGWPTAIPPAPRSCAAPWRATCAARAAWSARRSRSWSPTAASRPSIWWGVC